MTARVVAALACLLTCCAVGRGECLTGVTAWQNTAVPPRTGQFTVEFDATPNEPNGNGIVVMSLGPGSNFNDFAVLIRFKESGRIVVLAGKKTVKGQVAKNAPVNIGVRGAVWMRLAKPGDSVTVSGKVLRPPGKKSAGTLLADMIDIKLSKPLPVETKPPKKSN